MIVCVLDLDETLGFFDNTTFNVRPHVNFLINFLIFSKIDIILWSYGTDTYVESIINGHFPCLVQHAHKLFGRTQCKISEFRYGMCKSSEHIRKLYENEIVLIGIDDRVNDTMDDRYDMRILIEPYNKINTNDNHLITVIQKILDFCVTNIKNNEVFFKC